MAQTTVYVELGAGFGNQIFQYAMALVLNSQYGYKTFILPSRGNTHSQKNYQTMFNLVAHATEQDIPPQAILCNKTQQPYLWWDPIYFQEFQTVKLSGYYQNYQLFRSVIPQITAELRETFNTLYGIPEYNPLTTGFIHVRRADYLLPHAKMYNLQVNYYNEAIQYIEERCPGIDWIVISDDLAWCKKQKWSTKVVPNFYDCDDELKVFWTMLNCRAGAIIANSTFSYWAAMAGSMGPVVYPKAWDIFHAPDLFPEDWVCIGSRKTSYKE